MKVKKLSGKVQDAQQIPTLFDHENIMYYPINIVNWKEYPYHTSGCVIPIYNVLHLIFAASRYSICFRWST